MLSTMPPPSQAHEGKATASKASKEGRKRTANKDSEQRTTNERKAAASKDSKEGRERTANKDSEQRTTLALLSDALRC